MNSSTATSEAISETTSEATSETISEVASAREPGILSGLIGAVIAGALGSGCYMLLQAMVLKFPAISPNTSLITRNVSMALRYLLTGSMSLAAFMFGAVAVGLLAYSGQLFLQKLGKR